jgi:hypothetical protein
MNLVFANASKIRTTAACTVLFLHHVTKNMSKRRAADLEGRGSNSQKGAADVVLSVDGKGIAIVKSRDGSKDKQWSYSLDAVSIGKDADNDDVRAVVARVHSPTSEQTRPTAKSHGRAVGLTASAASALSVLQALTAVSCSVSEEDWRAACYRTMEGRTPTAKQRAFHRSKDALLAGKHVAHDEAGRWMAVEIDSLRRFDESVKQLIARAESLSTQTDIDPDDCLPLSGVR